MGDRTPAAGPARLGEEQLAAIENAALASPVEPFTEDVIALVAEVRAAWAENARYRAALEQYGDLYEAALNEGYLSPSTPEHAAASEKAFALLQMMRAALAAPGAGEEREA